MDYTYIIEKIQLDKVLKDFENDTKKYNVNNLGDRPNDYYERLSITNTKKWISPVLKLYLFKFLELERDKEFRIFVYNNEITGISQQFIYIKNEWLSQLKDLEIKILIKNICKFHKTLPIRDFNYTYDLVLLNSNEFYFIELNGFGGSYSAGSALFHWENDKYLLENSLNKITIRFTI
jgi:hypothetical protein